METETLEVFIQRLDRLEQAVAEVNLRLSSLGLGGRRGLKHKIDAEHKAKEAFVLELLRQGDISAGRAARLLPLCSTKRITSYLSPSRR